MNETYSNAGLVLGTKEMSVITVGPNKLKESFNNLNYVEVSVEDDLDIKLKGKLKDVGIILRAQHLDLLSMITDAVKFCLGKNHIEILLYPGDSDPQDFEEEIKELKDKSTYHGVWLEKNDIYSIKRYSEMINISFVSIPVNPLFYPKEVIDYCREHRIKVIATDIYGSKFTEEQMIEAFTRQFLDEFAMANSDLVVINSWNFERMVNSLLFMNNMVGEKIPEENKKMFTMKKSILSNKFENPIKKVVWSQVKVLDGINLSVIDRRTKYSPEFEISCNIGKNKEELISKYWINNSVFNKEIGEMRYPNGKLGKEIDDKTRKAYSRYYSMAIIQTVFKSKDWKMTVTIGSDFDTITVERKYLSWLWFIRPISFLIVPDKNTFYLIKLPYKKAKVL